MSLSTTPERPVSELDTVAELLEALGDISPKRVRIRPAPGLATEDDLLRENSRRETVCELVDGVLVEKPMGLLESLIACVLISSIDTYLRQHNIGVVAGEAGMMRLMPGLVRIPDVSFINWDRLRDEQTHEARVPDLAPDLAVEILSQGNTVREMDRKVREYFEAGVRLVWLVDPKTRSVRVFTGPEEETTVGPDGTLDGADVLPGFTLQVADWFDWAARKPPE